MSRVQNSPGLSYGRVLGYLVIAAVAMGAPLGVRAGLATYDCCQMQPLFRLAVQRASQHNQRLGHGSLELVPFSSKVVNGSRLEDARIEFWAHSSNGDARVIARGRSENGEWLLTYLEFQPAFGGWLVDGSMGGYKHVGKLAPLKNNTSP